MAVSVTPARPRLAARSMISDLRTGRRLRTAVVLARTSLRVLAGRASVSAAFVGQDRHLVEHGCAVGHRLDAVPAGSTDDVGTASAGKDDGPLEEQRIPAAPTRTMSSTLVVAGVIVLLGVYGTAAPIVHSVTGPVRRALRVLQAPETGRRGSRRRPTILHEVRATPTVEIAGDDARSEHTVVARIVREVPRVALDATVESTRSVAPARYAAARSRAFGPTTALWHAVELDRLAGAVDGACETTVCGSLVRVSTELTWPVPARDVCPACSTLAH